MSFFHKNEVKINLVNQQFNSKKCKSLCWGIFSQFILLMVGSRNSESTTWWCTYEKHINYSISCIQLKEIAISSVFPSPKNVLLTSDTPQCQYKCMIHENLFLKLDVFGHSYDKYESHISFGKYHSTYLLVAYLPHSVWCIYAYNLP